MNLKFLCCSIFSVSLYAVKIKFPDENTLRQTLGKHDYHYFMEKTKIHSVLADKHIEVYEFVEIINQAYDKYFDYWNKHDPARAHQALDVALLNRKRLIQVVTDNHYWALKELKENYEI